MKTNQINQEIDKYIKKFYLFKIIKGFIYLFILLSVLLFLLISFNYLFYFSITIKTIIYWSSFIIFLILFFDLIAFPFFRFLRIVKPISYHQASINISQFYKDIQDKLVNILELNKLQQNSPLVVASIKQKYNDIKIFNFSNAINFKDLYKYTKFVLIPILVYLLVYIFNSSLISTGYERFTNYTYEYEKPLPFYFKLANTVLEVQQGDDYKVLLEISGNIIPEEILINFGSNAVTMNKISNSKFEFFYDLKSVNRDLVFYFEANGYKSKIYTLKVIPSPKILNFTVNIFPPKYTNKKNYSINNTGDILVPYGSKLNFSFTTNSADSIYISTKSKLFKATKNKNIFNIIFIAKESFVYNIVALNKYINKKYFTYNLNIETDLFPSINIQSLSDSSFLSKYYFYGKISDDYGFSSLFFNYSVVDKSREQPNINEFSKIPIKFLSKNLSQEFFYEYDFSDLNISTDKTVYYYFSVYDNDVINNYKRTISSVMSYSALNIDELDSIVDAYNVEVEDKVLKANQLALDLQDDIENFNQKMLNESLNEWEKKEFIDNLLFKQKQLEKVIDSLKLLNSKKLNNIKNFDKQNRDLLEKQKQIQQLLDDLLTPELKKLIEEFKKLKTKFNDKDFSNTLKKSNSNYKKLQQDLDRSRELLKRMNIEDKINTKILELDKLSNDYKDLSKMIKKSDQLSDDFKDSIADANNKLKDILSDYDSLLNENKQLKKPFILDSLNDIKQELKKDILKNNNASNNNQKRQSQKSLDKTSDDIKKMSNNLKQNMQSNIAKSQSEDMQSIKLLLSNILTFSFDQENIYSNTKTNASIFSSKFKALKIQQLILSSDFKIINDSLRALASRNPSISKIVTDELFAINNNLSNANNAFHSSSTRNIQTYQRKILLSINKIALILNESLKNMQKQNSSGSGNSNSGKGQGLSNIKDFQKSMKENLEQMIQDMKDGKKPSSKQLGTQLAKREAFQKMLQQYMDENQLSGELKSLLQQTNQLNEKIKNDLINNNLTNETLLRDKKITTKLLESEKADDKRKFSNKRKSNTSDNINHSVQDNIINKFKSKSNYIEIVKTNNLYLNNFYKKYYNEYVIRLRNQ